MISLAAAAREADVVVVAGDTKVVRRGEGGGLYLSTTGIGVRPSDICNSDSIVSGPATRCWSADRWATTASR